MKNRSPRHYLYFAILENSFKIGITGGLVSRIKGLKVELKENIKHNQSFYYELDSNTSRVLEASLIRKYKSELIKDAIYVNETFNLTCIDSMIEDIENFHELFRYETVRGFFTDKYRFSYNNKNQLSIIIKKRRELKND